MDWDDNEGMRNRLNLQDRYDERRAGHLTDRAVVGIVCIVARCAMRFVQSRHNHNANHEHQPQESSKTSFDFHESPKNHASLRFFLAIVNRATGGDWAGRVDSQSGCTGADSLILELTDF